MRKKINHWPVFTLSLGFILPLASLGVYLAVSAQADQEAMVFEAVAPEPERVVVSDEVVLNDSESSVTLANETLYPGTKSMSIGGVLVEASIAKSWPERIKGLSGTPYLPADYVKLFVYDSPGRHSIWMKEMNYNIDIIWVGEDLAVIDFKEQATPESFPESFEPRQSALYVIETVGGFVAEHQIKIGTKIELPADL